MDDKTPSPRGGASHAVAAVVLAAVSTIVGIGLFLATASRMTGACIAAGNAMPSSCRGPWWSTPLIMLVVIGGWSSAAKVWRGR